RESIRGLAMARREGLMPVTYTNRRGVTYVLCQGWTATGKARYYFAREAVARESGRLLLDDMPEGYEIRENVNGQVSLAKVRPSEFEAQEVEAVATALARHPKGHLYRHEAKGRVITVFEQVGTEPALAARAIAGLFGLDAVQEARWLAQTVEYQRQYSRFDAVMRFTLVDREKRLFRAERMCYRSSLYGWLVLARSKPIDELARRYIPALGTERFFELFGWPED
ncbi:MAG: hypothetical protein JXA74_18320, partial [Anaerolineae bacterium]|nr:hypothetical protein [Anaerolineae bacterium]